MKPPTPRQRQILAAIREHLVARGFPPSIREIGATVGLRSTSTVHSHLCALEAHGHLVRQPGRPRYLTLTEPLPPDTRAALVEQLVARAVPWVRSKAESRDEYGSAPAQEWLQAAQGLGVAL